MIDPIMISSLVYLPTARLPIHFKISAHPVEGGFFRVECEGLEPFLAVGASDAREKIRAALRKAIA